MIIGKNSLDELIKNRYIDIYDIEYSITDKGIEAFKKHRKKDKYSFNIDKFFDKHFSRFFK